MCCVLVVSGLVSEKLKINILYVRNRSTRYLSGIVPVQVPVQYQ